MPPTATVFMANMTDPAIVQSISYGEPEIGDYEEFGNTWIYLDRAEIELMKLAARGITVFVSSGDTGASDLEQGFYTCPDPASNSYTFEPDWPTSSPHVVSVGATFFTTHYGPGGATNGMSLPADVVTGLSGSNVNSGDIDTSYIGEAVCGIDQGIFFTSGGGFRIRSELYPVQPWQESAVSNYLSSAAAQGRLPPTSLFNSAGRAYPDIAALGK